MSPAKIQDMSRNTGQSKYARHCRIDERQKEILLGSVSSNNNRYHDISPPSGSGKRPSTSLNHGNLTVGHKLKLTPSSHINSSNQCAQFNRHKVNQKKLSFLPDDDEDDVDEGNETVDPPRSPKNFVQPESTDNLFNDSKLNSSYDYPSENKKLPSKLRNHVQHDIIKKATTRPDLDHEDASSTSSCSCEDHSEISNQSEYDLHGDLDYDEDSVTASPQRKVAENSLLEDEVSQPTGAVSSGNQGASPTEHIDEDHTANEDGTSKQATCLTDSDPREDDESSITPSEMARQTSTSGQNKPSDDESCQATRLKSIINFNHEEKQGNTTTSALGSNDDLQSEYADESARSSKKYEHLLKYFFKDACYFQVKSINHENIQLSKSLGVWSTQIQNEVRFNEAFRRHRNVILIFSVQQSGAFQGFGRMVSESRQSARQVPWVLPPRMNTSSLGGVFKVDWLCTKDLSFQATQDLYNPYNSNKPVKVARDGQQVESKVGKKLCKLFPRDSRGKLLASIVTLKKQVSDRKKLSKRREEPLYPMPVARRNFSSHHRHIAEMTDCYMTTVPHQADGGDWNKPFSHDNLPAQYSTRYNEFPSDDQGHRTQGPLPIPGPGPGDYQHPVHDGVYRSRHGGPFIGGSRGGGHLFGPRIMMNGFPNRHTDSRVGGDYQDYYQPTQPNFEAYPMNFRFSSHSHLMQWGGDFQNPEMAAGRHHPYHRPARR